MADDNEILKLLQCKGDKGLEMMMDKYMGLVYTIVHSKIATICSKEDIEECVSDVFYELYKNSQKIDLAKASLKTFLALIAKRKAIDIYRKYYKQNTKTVSLEVVNDIDLIDLNSNGEELYSNRETRRLLIEGIKALGEPDSEILIRKYFFEQPSKAISEALDMKVNTIDKRISRALTKLKRIWEGEEKNGD